jgi:hypothetical protein
MELASLGIVSQFRPDILKLQVESNLISSYTFCDTKCELLYITRPAHYIPVSRLLMHCLIHFCLSSILHMEPTKFSISLMQFTARADGSNARTFDAYLGDAQFDFQTGYRLCFFHHFPQYIQKKCYDSTLIKA